MGEGDQYTIVIIHKALGHMTMAHPGAAAAEAAQHLAITGHYVPKSGKQADYYYILPSIHEHWAWYNKVNWWVALAYSGGSGAGDAQVGILLGLGVLSVVSLFLLPCVTLRIARWGFATIQQKTRELTFKHVIFQFDQSQNKKCHQTKYIEVGNDDGNSDKIKPQEIGSVSCV